MAIARLNTDGSLDNTFSGDGKFTLNLTNKSLECQKLIVQPDGKIIAAGTLDTIVQDAFFRNEFFCTRLNVDGTIDNTFGVNGIQRQKNSISDNCYTAGLMPDGKIILGGFSSFTGYNTPSFLCLFPNGTVNTNYGTNGWQYVDLFGGTQFVMSIAIQKDGKAIFGGYGYFSDQSNAIIVGRLKKNGAPDNTFVSGGVDTFFRSTSSNAVACFDLALQKDGNILITGYKTLSKEAFLTARISNPVQLEKMEPDEPTSSSSLINELSIYPNPVSSNPMILSFNLQQPSTVSISITDLSGKQIIMPIAKEFPEGPNSIELNFPESITAGMYLCLLNVANEVQTLKFEMKF